MKEPVKGTNYNFPKLPKLTKKYLIGEESLNTWHWPAESSPPSWFSGRSELTPALLSKRLTHCDAV